jgi:LmbE family N-acetylglucosaminyl deacetylase
MSKPTAFAIAAHPDDIELMMAGTLILLGEAGYDLHVMNIANGSCGSMTEDGASTAARRTDEARASAKLLGAQFHPPLTNDIEIFYEKTLLRKLAAVVRSIAPKILLVQSPQDYMEDHMNACRLAVTAAFTRGMPNYVTDPPVGSVDGDITVYHALPWGLRGPMGESIAARQFVNVQSVLPKKRAALACHQSQKEWLDQTQGLDSYLDTMEAMSREVGAMSGLFEVAEGWRKHLHLGFCSQGDDPLTDALGNRVLNVQEDG